MTLDRTQTVAMRLQILYEKQKSILERLRIYQQNLDTLLLQKARFSIEVPLRLENEIRFNQSEIVKLEEELDTICADIDKLTLEQSHLSQETTSQGIAALGPVLLDRFVLSIENEQYEVEAHFPPINAEIEIRPDESMITTVNYAGGFHIKAVAHNTSPGLKLEFFRHNRKIAPDLDRTHKKLILPLGIHMSVGHLDFNPRDIVKGVDDIPLDRVEHGIWTLIGPSQALRIINRVEQPPKGGFVITSQIVFDAGYEVWTVLPENGPTKVWFYIGDWLVAPMVNETKLAIAFPTVLQAGASGRL